MKLSSPPDDLPIAGVVPVSTVDWPGRLVATVFTQGCPWRCSYCHNPDLIDVRRPGTVAWEEVVALLDARRGLLDGVVLTGGEPTMHRMLPQVIGAIHDLEFDVGLHTAGVWPARLAALLPQLDWVGLDIKAPPRGYRSLTEAAPSGRAAYASLALVVESGVDHEIRTTVDPSVHSREDILEVAARVRAAGARRHVLQPVRDAANGSDSGALGAVLEPDDLPELARR